MTVNSAIEQLTNAGRKCPRQIDRVAVIASVAPVSACLCDGMSASVRRTRSVHEVARYSIT